MTDIGWVGLGISGSLVAVAVALSLWRQLGLERSIAVAVTPLFRFEHVTVDGVRRPKECLAALCP